MKPTPSLRTGVAERNGALAANAGLYWPRRILAVPVSRELGVINRAVGASPDWLVAALPTKRHSRSPTNEASVIMGAASPWRRRSSRHSR